MVGLRCVCNELVVVYMCLCYIHCAFVIFVRFFKCFCIFCEVFQVLDGLMFKDGFQYKRVALSSLI